MIARLSAIAGIAFLLVAPLGAHHPFTAEYDWKQPVTVTGAVSKFEWSNPHARMFVDVKDASGKTVTWNFEMGGLAALEKAGWKKTTVKNGDMVTVDAWLAKTKGSIGNMKSIKVSNGQELSAGSSIVDPEANAPSTTKGKS